MRLLKKSKFLWIGVVLLAVMEFGGGSDDARAMPERKLRLITDTASHELRVEYAKDPVDLMRGLMFRKTIAPFDGMIFDFGIEKPVQMWMKNTDIPLDMVFFDDGKRIVHIHHNAIPQDETTISSPSFARYVLEIDAGKAEALALSAGQYFEWIEE